MFDLSIEKIVVLALVALFVLGPERLPAAAQWLGKTVRQVKDYATGAHEHLRSELGPEFEQFRGPLEDLRSVRDLDPRRALRRHLFDDPPSDGSWSGAPTPATPHPATATGALARAEGSASASGAPAGGPGAVLKGQSDRAAPLREGEQAPLDQDAT